MLVLERYVAASAQPSFDQSRIGDAAGANCKVLQ